MTWNVDPVLLHLGPLSVRWYGLLFALGFMAGYQVMKRLLLRDSISLKHLDRLLVYVAIGTVVGARLGHTLFYEPETYLADPIRILKIWEGGLASHGAAIGIVVSLWIYSIRYREIPLLELLDKVCITVALAGVFIRLGNLFNSEIVGRPTTVPWAVVFTRIDSNPRHPTQIYEALTYLAIFAALGLIYRDKAVRERRGFVLGLFLIGVFGARFLIEFLKENQVSFESSLPLNLGQLLSIPAVLIGIFLVFWSSKRAPQAPATREKRK